MIFYLPFTIVKCCFPYGVSSSIPPRDVRLQAQDFFFTSSPVCLCLWVCVSVRLSPQHLLLTVHQLRGELPSELQTATPTSFCFPLLFISVPMFPLALFTSLLLCRGTQLEFEITYFKGVLLRSELWQQQIVIKKVSEWSQGNKTIRLFP